MLGSAQVSSFGARYALNSVVFRALTRGTAASSLPSAMKMKKRSMMHIKNYFVNGGAKFCSSQSNDTSRTQLLLDIVQNDANGSTIQDKATALVKIETTLTEMNQLVNYLTDIQNYKDVTALYECAKTLHGTVNGRSGFSDETLLTVLKSYVKLGKPAEVREMIPLFKNNMGLMRIAVNDLLHCYCQTDRLEAAEQMLAQWLSIWLNAGSVNSSYVSTSNERKHENWNSLLQNTLVENSSSVFDNSIIQDRSTMDLSSIRSLLAKIQKRYKNQTSTGLVSSDSRMDTVFNSDAMQIIGASAFPDFDTWALFAHMYSVRGADQECMSVLDISNLGKVHRNKDIYYSCIKVSCFKLNFQQAIMLMHQMRDAGMHPDVYQQSLLLRYLMALETVDATVLRLLIQGTRNILDQNQEFSHARNYHALTEVLIELLCHHNQAKLAASFIEHTSNGVDILTPSSLALVVHKLATMGDIDSAIKIFMYMIDHNSPRYQTIYAAYKPGIGAAIENAYHHLCLGMENDPQRLAYFVVAYKQSFLKSN